MSYHEFRRLIAGATLPMPPWHRTQAGPGSRG